LNKNATQALV